MHFTALDHQQWQLWTLPVVVVVVCPLAAAVARSERYRPHESPGESCLSLVLFERPPTLGGQVFPVNSLSEGPGFPVNSLK
jgi:hypothetical protein